MITKENIVELWELYEEYKKDFYTKYYPNVKCYQFEEFVEKCVIYSEKNQKFILDYMEV